MTSKLKRDQLPKEKALNWKKSLKEEEKLTFNLKVPQIVLEKETYKKLAGENENRVRIYLGLEPLKDNEKPELCAYAVSAFLLGSGDVYADYEIPVYKLEKKNIDLSSNTQEVIESIRSYRSWRAGEINPDDEGASIRKYIYPNAYLLTKYELHELFVAQDQSGAQIEFGIAKTMNLMMSAVSSTALKSTTSEVGEEVFDDAGLCPPYCDERSIYNS